MHVCVCVCGQKHDVNGALDLKREMEDRGFVPDQNTYAQLLWAAAYGDAEDAAFRKMFDIYNEMIVTKELPPLPEHFAALIAGCGHIADIETATKVLHLMDSMNVPRTPKVYLSYLRAIAGT
ncbi:hypothetical protein RFI_33216, partial [Reticulomyxa filosa]